MSEQNNKKPKVLFIAGGKRVTLAEMFIEKGCEVISYEREHNTPISKVCKTIVTSTEFGQESFKQVYRLIADQGIDLVIPLTEPAVKFCGDFGIGINSQYSTNIFTNKLKFQIDVLSTWCTKHYPLPLSYPLIYKPVEGYGSQGIEIRNSWFYDNLKNNIKYIAQRYIIDGDEYSVDSYFDRDNKMKQCVVRSRDKIVGGEVVKSSIYNGMLLRDQIYSIVESLGEKMYACGPTCFQFVVDMKEYKPYIMEANLRFGGGSTLSMKAGYDMIGMLLDEYVYNKPIDPSRYNNVNSNMSMSRCFRDFYFSP